AALRDVELGDVDGDGLPDTVAAADGISGVRVFHNLGGGVLASAHQAGTAANVTSVELGDIDAAGRLDIAGGGSQTGSQPVDLVVLRSLPTGGFTTAFSLLTSMVAAHDTRILGLTDLDGDGLPDVQAACEGRLMILDADGLGSVRPPRAYLIQES